MDRSNNVKAITNKKPGCFQNNSGREKVICKVYLPFKTEKGLCLTEKGIKSKISKNKKE